MSEHSVYLPDWSKLVAVTNRSLCRESFFERLEKIFRHHPRAVILREKDLEEQEYRRLADEVLALGKSYAVPVILHSWPQTAALLEADGLHMPLPLLRRLSAAERQHWNLLGTSCHSVEDVYEAEQLGCKYLIAGHIYETDCKRGMPGRGLNFLQAACKATALPVFAIGGITLERLPAVLTAGAVGACIMSGLMKGDNWLGKMEVVQDK